MKTVHNLVQGSPEWHQFRLEHDGASEAAAMLGMSPKVTRAELLKMKHTGLAREFSDWLQANVLDKGHEVEALARPHVEVIIGEDLYPATISDGRQSASCDGLTLDDRIAFEHKQAAEALFATVSAGQMPAEHMPQCQQVLMVTGAERLIFVVSDGTPERMAYVWVDPDPAWFQRLRDGWALFHRDLAAYVLPDTAPAAPVGQAPETLPALRIEITGAVTASNLAEFKATALGAIRSVNRELATDQHFADAERAVKWCGEVESRLAAAKDHALSQTATIDALFKTIDEISAEARRVRLDLDKLVTRRKTEVKDEAVSKARRALDTHIATLNGELAPMRVPQAVADFAGAIKGKRSISSMQDALDQVLTVAKIAAEADARGIRANVAAFQQQAAGLEFLFADLGAIVHKAADDFAAVVAQRIGAHRAAEAQREAKRKSDEEARIHAEAQRLAAQQIEQQRRADAAAALAQQQAQAAPQQAAAPAPAPVVQAGTDNRPAGRRAVDPLVSVTFGPTQAQAAALYEPATLTLGEICGRLGFTVRADFLADALHVSPAKIEGKRPGTYTESQYQLICRQLLSHVSAMAELYAGEPA